MSGLTAAVIGVFSPLLVAVLWVGGWNYFRSLVQT